MNLFLIRHCNRLDRDDPDWKEKSLNLLDAPLTEKGIYRSMEIANYFNDIIIDAIYSSPFLRCIQTSYPISLKTRCNIKVDNRLSERYLTKWYPEIPPGTLGNKQLFNYYPTIDLSYNIQNLPFYPEKEIDENFNLRVKSFWESIVYENKSIIVVAHGDPLMQIKRILSIDPYVSTHKGSLLHLYVSGGKGEIINEFYKP